MSFENLLKNKKENPIPSPSLSFRLGPTPLGPRLPLPPLGPRPSRLSPPFLPSPFDTRGPPVSFSPSSRNRSRSLHSQYTDGNHRRPALHSPTFSPAFCSFGRARARAAPAAPISLSLPAFALTQSAQRTPPEPPRFTAHLAVDLSRLHPRSSSW